MINLETCNFGRMTRIDVFDFIVYNILCLYIPNSESKIVRTSDNTIVKVDDLIDRLEM